jgi:hypothetical protein
MRPFRRLVLWLIVPLITAAQPPANPIAAPPLPPASAALPSQTDQLATPSIPRTTIPSDSNAIARPANDKACRNRIAAAKGHPVDILFVGDSITEAWT